MQKEELEAKIEEVRTYMYDLYKENPQNPEIIKVSQALDNLLNELNQLLEKIKEKD